MKMKSLISLIVITTVLVIGVTSQGVAQQNPQLHLYGQDLFLINPASAGQSNSFKAFLDSRKNFSGIAGAPATTTFGIHSAYSDKVGLGLYIQDDQAGYFGRFTANFNYAYKLKFNKSNKHFLSFGLGIGFIENHINFDGMIASDQDDILLTNYQGFSLDARFGLDYHWNGLQLGVSIPTLIDNDVELFRDGTNDYQYKMKRHYLGYAAYQFNLKVSKTEDGQAIEATGYYIQPSILYHYLPSEWQQLDVNLTVGSHKGYWVGFTVRPTNMTYAVAAGFKVMNLGISYSYEIPGSDLTSYSSSSHEVMLTYQFKSQKMNELDLKQEIQDLFDGQKDQDAKLKQQQEEIDSLKNQPQSVQMVNQQPGISQEQFDDMQKKMMDEIESLRGELNKKAIDEGKAVEKATAVSTHVPLTKEGIAEIDKMRKELNESSKNVMIADGDEIVKITAKPAEGGGQNYLEEAIPDGNYIIVYSFRELERAKVGVKLANTKGYESYILFNKTRGWYYIYVEYFEQLKPALAKMEQIRLKDYNDAWVHIYKAPKE